MDRDKRGPDDDQPAQAQAQAQAQQKAQGHAWRLSSPLSCPSRALFVRFARALLATADVPALAQLLPARALTGALLNHLASDPAAEVLATLRVVGRRVLGPGLGLPPRLQAEPFGDVALQQLAELSGSSDEPAPPAAEGDGEALAMAAAAAHEVLCMLCTEPSHGLVTQAPHGAASGSAASPPDAGTGLGVQYSGGVKRVLRLLPRLQPLERLRHAQLLRHVAQRLPWLAAEFASSMPFDLEPKVRVQLWGCHHKWPSMLFLFGIDTAMCI